MNDVAGAALDPTPPLTYPRQNVPEKVGLRQAGNITVLRACPAPGARKPIVGVVPEFSEPWNNLQAWRLSRHCPICSSYLGSQIPNLCCSGLCGEELGSHRTGVSRGPTYKPPSALWFWARQGSAPRIWAGLSKKLPTLGPTPSQDASSSGLASWGSSLKLSHASCSCAHNNNIIILPRFTSRRQGFSDPFGKISS